MGNRDCVILIFAKAPIAGRVKTRLIPALGEFEAMEIYRMLLYHLVCKLAGVKLCDIKILCAPDALHPEFQYIQSLLNCSLIEQEGNDLGQRMSNAVRKALQQYRYVILIGVDCPEMSIKYLRQAMCHLNEGADAVLGPAEDGGYVLLGISKMAGCLFDGPPWGTENVLEFTQNCFLQMGWDWVELPKLWDVDRPEDVERLRMLLAM